jgi:phenylalanyl-tRNA synthetase beta chain
MLISYEWLRSLAATPELPVQQAANLLTMAGFNVEQVTIIDYLPLLVGRILSQEPHPKSRKPLWIHQVDLGGETRQIIAGASNAIPGSLVPVALPGTVVPSGTEVRDGRIAGQESRGMLCSASELVLEDDSEGILVLAKGSPGQPLEEVIPSDAILEVDVTPNRPDCLGHLGLARELAATSGIQLKFDFMPPFTGGVEPSGSDLVDIAIEAPDLCRRYIGAVISGVKVAPSPDWMQRRLRRVGVRPLNNVVDITNYVQLEYGQPLHAFDLDAIAERQIRVRRARVGEQLRCLDGQTRRLTPNMLVIADAQWPVAIAGVIGGEESGVTERTRDVLLEAAAFDPISVRSTSRALRLRTESSSRFEKGLSPELALAGARRAAMLLADLAGGEIHLDWADTYPRPQVPVQISFRPEQVEQILGAEVAAPEMESILKRLEFQVKADPDGPWEALPPVYRLDVTLPEDIAEEVGRIHGYDKVPATLPGRRRQTWQTAAPSQERLLDRVRVELCGAGYWEILGPALVSGRTLQELGKGEDALSVINPVSEDQDTLRTTLLATLLPAAARNRRGRDQCQLFELGRAYLRRPEDPAGQPQELSRLGVLQLARAEPEAGREAFLEVKGAFERAAQAERGHNIGYEATSGAGLFHPGRCARVLIDGQPAGYIGELHPEVMDRFDLPGRAVALEVSASALLEGGRDVRARPLSRFPAVERDLAVVVPNESAVAALKATIEEGGGELLEAAPAFDEYHGEQVGAGCKSVAFSLTFRAPDRTLTDSEVDQQMKQVRNLLEERHQASFR